MKRKHTVVMAVGVLALAIAWFAWNVLLTESEEPVQLESPGTPIS